MIPGIYPKIVRRRHIQNSIMQPYLKNTPRGGKKMAIRMSQHVAKPPPFPMMMSSSNCTRQTKFLKVQTAWVQLQLEIGRNSSSRRRRRMRRRS
jgi:hypothetical protein